MPSSNDISLYQMASGLAYIHEKGFVHRDIKGDNVLIYKATSGLIQLKISDFGLSKPISTSGKYSMSGPRGNTNFLAPELLQRHDAEDNPSQLSRRMTISSDIFALGCLFYSFLTKGKHPFAHPSGPFFIPQNILEGKYHLDCKLTLLYFGKKTFDERFALSTSVKKVFSFF